MTSRLANSKLPKEEYLKKAAALSEDEAEKIMSRLRGPCIRRIENGRITALEALALQLELEEDQLAAWRARIAETRNRSKN